MSYKIGRKKLPVTSTHQCFHLIYFILYHTGYLGCKIRNKKQLYNNKRYIFYGYVYRIIYLAGFTGGCAYKMNDAVLKEAVTNQLTPVLKVILTFECVICPTVYLITTIYLDMQCETYVKLANTLQDLDDKLYKNFPGIQWNYDKSARKYSSMTIGGYVFYALVSTIYVFYVANCKSGWISSTIISICYACISSAPSFAGFLFIGNMDLLRLRFRLIRQLVRQNLFHLNNKDDISKVKLLQSLFEKYCGLITLINKVFCTITASSLFHDFSTITCLGYLLCYQAIDDIAEAHEYVFTVLFMAPRLYKFINTGLYGYATQKARRNCEHDFIKIGYLFKKSPAIQQQTELFLHWRMHNNYRFTVGKIMKCNLTLIFLTLNSIINYIMILIQLQFQQNSIEKFIAANKN